MKDKIFFDTNIIVYAYDTAEQEKRNAAKELMKAVYNQELTGIVSNQVLAEVFTVLTNKINASLDIETSGLIIENITDSDNWVKINYTQSTVKAAIEVRS